MIEEWLNMEVQPEDNKPLVIEADRGVGKKTLLVKWYEYHQSLNNRRNNDLVLLHFATTGGNNSNYFYALYRMLIKLREELNIDQKVELHDEKLRKYFAYWLDVCDQRIENQAIKNLDIHYNKIILVFEGIDYFLDKNNGREGNIAFWLPKIFPKNVKVIVTADKDSESMKYFSKLDCHRVTMPTDIAVMRTMIKSHFDKELCVEGNIRNELMWILEENIKKPEATSLYAKVYMNCLLPEKPHGIDLSEGSLKKLQECLGKIDKKQISNIKNVEEMFGFVL